MPLTTQSQTQLQTIFGGGYIPEQHGDATHGYLPHSEAPVVNFDEAIKAMSAAMFDEMLKSLRSALSLR